MKIKINIQEKNFANFLNYSFTNLEFISFIAYYNDNSVISCIYTRQWSIFAQSKREKERERERESKRFNWYLDLKDNL